MKKIVIASGNKGKIKEIKASLEGFNVELVSQADLSLTEAVEDGLSFVENALIKARSASGQSGLSAIADDSGIVVPSLDGAPGIYSARYAGESANSQDNMDKLLSELNGVSGLQRRAYFYCALVYVNAEKDPTPIIAEGLWEGVIAQSKTGNEGFGYDPVFFLPSLKRCAAELSLAEKNQISHRGLALKRFATMYQNRYVDL